MEIGSWEGMSCTFVLKTLFNSNITCVDTWEGSDEHELPTDYNTIESVFDLNTAPFKERITKFKGTSQKFFGNYLEKDVFDLIYIDGSHHCDDVIVDAIRGFPV